jgi:2-C-methyl-D-erythritol 2,4-cyclodiphosphate synthase
MLGGVKIPHDRGLLGHSDGDAILHALTDALLGAAGLGDIGEFFPDTDPKYQNADSKIFLIDAASRVRAGGYTIGNVDIIVHAERPNLSDFKRPIAESVAAMLEIPPKSVNVKAKTNEGLGPVGNREGIGCTVITILFPE